MLPLKIGIVFTLPPVVVTVVCALALIVNINIEPMKNNFASRI